MSLPPTRSHVVFSKLFVRHPSVLLTPTFCVFVSPILLMPVSRTGRNDLIGHLLMLTRIRGWRMGDEHIQMSIKYTLSECVTHLSSGNCPGSDLLLSLFGGFHARAHTHTHWGKSDFPSTSAVLRFLRYLDAYGFRHTVSFTPVCFRNFLVSIF